MEPTMPADGRARMTLDRQGHPVNASSDYFAETDADGFPKRLPFSSPTDSVTRHLLLAAKDLRKGDVVDLVDYKFTVLDVTLPGEGETQVKVRRRPGPGRVLTETYPPNLEMRVARTKRYVRTPDQRSVTDQLRDLIGIATREGMYDAADYLSHTIEEKP